jgi:hypothetical protein
VPERVGSKVLPIPTKSRLSLLTEQPEALGEQQEPPRIYAGEVSAVINEISKVSRLVM